MFFLYVLCLSNPVSVNKYNKQGLQLMYTIQNQLDNFDPMKVLYHEFQDIHLAIHQRVHRCPSKVSLGP